MIGIVWVISTTTPLVTCKGFAITCENVGMNCFILDEGGQCYKDGRDKIFSKDGAEHEPCKTTNVKEMLLRTLCFRAMKFLGRKFYKEGRMK